MKWKWFYYKHQVPGIVSHEIYLTCECSLKLPKFGTGVAKKYPLG